MKITRNLTEGAKGLRVRCLECGYFLSLYAAHIDLDGPAFQAYYHEGCVPQEAK
jgi:hypothetical protein